MGTPMKLRILRRQRIALLLSFALVLVAKPVLAQSPPSEQPLQARIDAAAVALGSNPRFKKTSLKFRQEIMEFVIGNILFAMLHELGHAAADEMGLPILGKEEDAADSFAVVRLIRLGSVFSHRVLVEAAKGWFLSVRRDKKEGDEADYYDAHGFDQQRAYQIVCLMVGADPVHFKDLADETKLPEDRQKDCVRDYSKASASWELVLKPHLRSVDQPKTKIDVVYGEGKGDRLESIARVLRSIKLLETLAERWAGTFAWPESFALEAETCGFPNAAWVQATPKLTLCYELLADYGDLYRTYGATPTTSRKRKSK
jgi:Putative metallopeptidase